MARTRIFVINIDRWKGTGRAHGEVFGTIRPEECRTALISAAVTGKIDVRGQVS